MAFSLRSAAKSRWRNLRYGFFFLPGAIGLAFVALAFGVVAIDRLGGPNGVDIGFGGGASAARSVLSTIAGSLITVAGLTFSITIVTLQLVSQQVTPRALRNFLGDRLTQSLAGAFVGIFAYCLLVLRAVRESDEGFEGFVPSLSVTIGIALGIVALALLLYFIHHIARSIQVGTLAGEVAHSTLAALDRLYPAPFGEPTGERVRDVVQAWERERDPQVVFPGRPGYVQTIALGELAAGLDEPGLRVHLPVTPGQFVSEADPIGVVWNGRSAERAEAVLRAAVVVTSERNVEQDALYGVRQLADMSIKALSPSVNDPTTAWTCIHYLRAILERLAARALPGEVRHYEEQDLVVVAPTTSFEEYVDAAFVQVARYASGDARVAAALLEAIAHVAEAARRAGAEERLRCLQRAAEAVAGPAREDARTEEDRRLLEERLRTLS